jgi:hypothetical protein
MEPIEKIEKLIKERRYKASAETYDKALGSFLQAVDEHVKQKSAPSEPKIWRKIMKSRTTKLATAAIILITAYIVLHQSGGLIDTVTFAQIRENMKQMPWLHAVAEVKQAAGAEMIDIRCEVWFCIERKLSALKDSGGKVTFQNELEHIFQAYDPNTETITIPPRDKRLSWNKNLSSVVDVPGAIIKVFEDSGEKVVRETGKYKGKDVLIFRTSALLAVTGQISDDMDMKVEMAVDAERQVVVFITQKAFDKDGKLTEEVNAHFDYPAAGPETIYDVGVPKSAKIVRSEKEEEKIVYDQTFEEEISAVDARESWPEPRDLVVAYWQARNAKNYEEMSVLWPGSETWNQSLEKEEPVEYVFGEAQPTKSEDYIIVPYASKIHFDEHGEYNLKMVLSKRGSSKKRYYIVSGN